MNKVVLAIFTYFSFEQIWLWK